MSLDYPNPNFTEEVHVDLGTENVPAGNDELTITAWINVDNDQLAADQVIIAKSASTGNSGEFKLQVEEPDNELRGIINDNELTGTTIMGTGVWIFVAMVYDGVNKVLFIDAVQDATEAQTGNVATSADPLIMAGLDDGSVRRSFDGLLADIRVYTRAL